RAVTAGHNSPDPALEKSALGKIADIGTGKILDEAICAAPACLVTAGQNDVAQSRHFIRAESDWTFGAHLHARPAIVVVRRRYHGNRRDIERELGKISHGRHYEAEIVHGATRGHQALGECDLDSHGIGAEIVTRHDMWLHAQFMDQSA